MHLCFAEFITFADAFCFFNHPWDPTSEEVIVEILIEVGFGLPVDSVGELHHRETCPLEEETATFVRHFVSIDVVVRFIGAWCAEGQRLVGGKVVDGPVSKSERTSDGTTSDDNVERVACDRPDETFPLR